MHSNVVAIDYRGYGLSPGAPTEQTCFEDARSAWDFVVDVLGRVDPKLNSEDSIGVLGHSLGGCIAADMVTTLAKEGEPSVEEEASAVKLI